MVEMKNPIKEADANPEVNHLSLWRTDLAYFWVINCDAKIQDDMHYHENGRRVHRPHATQGIRAETIRHSAIKIGGALSTLQYRQRKNASSRRRQYRCRRQAPHARAQDPEPHSGNRAHRRLKAAKRSSFRVSGFVSNTRLGDPKRERQRLSHTCKV